MFPTRTAPRRLLNDKIKFDASSEFLQRIFPTASFLQKRCADLRRTHCQRPLGWSFPDILQPRRKVIHHYVASLRSSSNAEQQLRKRFWRLNHVCLIVCAPIQQKSCSLRCPIGIRHSGTLPDWMRSTPRFLCSDVPKNVLRLGKTRESCKLVFLV